MVSVFADSDCECVESQTFSVSRKRDAPFVASQGDMNIGGTLEKTPPVSRKKIRGIEYGGKRRWTARDRTVIAKMEHYLDRCESLEVNIEELEYYLLDPDELDVDIRHIALNARGEQQQGLSPHVQSAGNK